MLIIIYRNEVIPNFDNGMERAALDTLSGSSPAVIVFPKSWNNTGEILCVVVIVMMIMMMIVICSDNHDDDDRDSDDDDRDCSDDVDRDCSDDESSGSLIEIIVITTIYMIIYLIHLTLINSSIYLFTLYSHFCSN